MAAIEVDVLVSVLRKAATAAFMADPGVKDLGNGTFVALAGFKCPTSEALNAIADALEKADAHP